MLRVTVAALLLLPGCYEHHLRDPRNAGASVDAGADGGRDAAADSPDACALHFVDPGAPPAEADVPAGARPSDLPSAAEWIDPPDPHAGRCCDVRFVETPRCERARATGPAVWNGAEWGSTLRLSTSTDDEAFVRFDDQLRPVAPSVRLEETDFWYWHWGRAGYLTMRSHWHPDWETHVYRFDRGGARIGATTIPLDATSAVRVPSQHAWAIFGTDDHRIDRSEILVLYDDELREIDRADFRVLEVGMSFADATRVVNVGGRIVTLERPHRLLPLEVRSFEAPGLSEITRVTFDRPDAEMYGDFATLRDEIVVVESGVDWRGGQFLSMLDPFEGVFTTDRALVAASPGPSVYVGLADLVADDAGGTLAMCRQTVWSEERRTLLEVVILDRLGRMLGDPVELTTESVHRCHLARRGPDRFVAYWGSPHGDLNGATITVRR